MNLQLEAHYLRVIELNWSMMSRLMLSADCDNPRWRHELLHVVSDVAYAQDRLWENGEMVKKTAQAGPWKGFVDVRLTAEQRQQYQGWAAEDDDVLAVLFDEVLNGYKFTLSFNSKNQSFTASLTAVGTGGGNDGYTLSSFGAEPWVAVRVLIYKHRVISEGDWSSVGAGSSDSWG